MLDFIHLLLLEVEKHCVASIVSHLVILVQVTYCAHVQKESGWREEVSPVSFRDTLISSWFFSFLLARITAQSTGNNSSLFSCAAS